MADDNDEAAVICSCGHPAESHDRSGCHAYRGHGLWCLCNKGPEAAAEPTRGWW